MKASPDDEKAMQSISRQTRTAGYDIVRLKGATDYAVATGVVRIVEAILRDENTLLIISSPTQHYGISEVCLSLPTKVNRKGSGPYSASSVKRGRAQRPGDVPPRLSKQPLRP